jgi:hypothetical protein
MNKEKQIKEIQDEIIRWGENADRTGNYGYALSEHLVDQGYRKIYDDNQRQCTCYALGCQMAEELERTLRQRLRCPVHTPTPQAIMRKFPTMAICLFRR